MKSLIFVLLLSASTLYADPFTFYSYGEFGYYHSKIDSIHRLDKLYFDAFLVAGIKRSLLINIEAFAEAELYTDMIESAGFRFSPVQQNYFVRAGLWFGPFSLMYEHLCRHSVDKIDYRINGGHDRISIGFDSRR